MSRVRSFAWVACIALAAILLCGAPRTAFADDGPSVEFLASRLKSDDFRVRVNAALRLGGMTGDDAPRAVQPLCDAIGDDKDVVRQAVAAALKRLGKQEGLPCLRNRLGSEPSNDVKLSITRAIEALEAQGGGGNGGNGGSGGGGPVANNPNAKYYLAYTLSNNSGRPTSEIEALVLPPMKQKLDGAGTFQMAPANESADAARAVMQKRNLKGLYLSVGVDVTYIDDPTNGLTLKVKLRIAVSNYPGKALKGGFDKGLSQGVSKRGDKASEDNLLNMAAGLAFDQFAQNAQMFL